MRAHFKGSKGRGHNGNEHARQGSHDVLAQQIPGHHGAAQEGQFGNFVPSQQQGPSHLTTTTSDSTLSTGSAAQNTTRQEGVLVTDIRYGSTHNSQGDLQHIFGS